MNALYYRAGMGRTFEDGLLLFIHLQGCRKFEYDIDTCDPAGIGFHDLQNRQFHAFKVNLEVAGFNAHGRSHTGSQGGSYQVSRGKTLSSALVVGGGIGLYFSSGLEMLGNRM